jgi:hypothetical protein
MNSKNDEGSAWLELMGIYIYIHWENKKGEVSNIIQSRTQVSGVMERLQSQSPSAVTVVEEANVD